MTALSPQLINSFSFTFSPFIPRTPLEAGSTGHNYSSVSFNRSNFNPVFVRAFIDDITGLIEVPSLVRAVGTINRLKSPEEFYKEVVYPINVMVEAVKTTSNSAFKFLLSPINIYSYMGIKKVTIKDKVYYGGTGIILDKNFIPIMIGVYRYDSQGDHMENVLKVSPEVFLNDSLIEKGILKTLIPFYITHEFDGHTAKVEIDDDLGKYVVKPIPPIKSEDVPERMKDIMHNFKREILESLFIS